MPNIGALLKEEISRLSRREVRKQVASMKRASIQYRRHIAALKREVAGLRRQVALLVTRAVRNPPTAPVGPTARPARFGAKGLRAHRLRVGLSASDYGRLVGVGSQSIYNWEQGAAKPSAAHRATLVELRSIGKREAHALLEPLRGKNEGARRRS
jgi:hypothetical protein